MLNNAIIWLFAEPYIHEVIYIIVFEGNAISPLMYTYHYVDTKTIKISHSILFYGLCIIDTWVDE